jgi:hypothetical protein
VSKGAIYSLGKTHFGSQVHFADGASLIYSEFECGYKLNVGFIIGGEQSARGEFPFIALLGYVALGRDNFEQGFAFCFRPTAKLSPKGQGLKCTF